MSTRSRRNAKDPAPEYPQKPQEPSAPLQAKIADFAPDFQLPTGPSESEEIGSHDLSDPLPSIEIPDDRPVITIADLAASAIKNRGATSVTGAAQGITALLLRKLVTKHKRRVVAITPDTETARALSQDVSFLLSAHNADDAEAGETSFGSVLLYLPNETTPYAEVNPDRRGAQARLATLFHIGMDLPWSVLVCPISALARKVVPKEDVLEHAELLVTDQDMDREKLTSRLGASGYVRSPLVEDPGTFAVRGSLLDVWPPLTEMPIRIELLGDAV